MTPYTNEYLRGLVRDDRVHRSIYTDPRIFELEMEKIFSRVWIYVGHESQIPNPGDFYCTWIARQPVVMARHVDGKVYVLFNRCGHRGARVRPEILQRQRLGSPWAPSTLPARRRLAERALLKQPPTVSANSSRRSQAAARLRARILATLSWV